jgi:hypothetical protein
MLFELAPQSHKQIQMLEIYLHSSLQSQTDLSHPLLILSRAANLHCHFYLLRYDQPGYVSQFKFSLKIFFKKIPGQIWSGLITRQPFSFVYLTWPQSGRPNHHNVCKIQLIYTRSRNYRYPSLNIEPERLASATLLN